MSEKKLVQRDVRGSSAGFAGATSPGGRLRKGGEAPLRVSPAKEFFNFGKPFEQRIQFTEAIRAGNFVFVSGMSAIDDEGRVIAPGDPETQGRAVFETLKAALELAGAKLSDVVMETEFVTDMALYKPIARIRREYFPDHYPTATLVEVKGLWKPGLVFEMNAIAVLGTGEAGPRGAR